MSDFPDQLYLLNCRECSDIQMLTEKPRACECGKSRGILKGAKPAVEGEQARLFSIPWETYDLCSPERPGAFHVLTLAKPRHSR